MSYSNSFQSGLVFDNAGIIGRDPRIRAVTTENIHAILTGSYWYVNAAAGLYRPLTTLSYLLNYAALGNGPRTPGYHAVNLILHEINVALVYALGVLVFRRTAPAIALAAIWGVHPLLTEAVTNIVGRADLLAAFGVLAGILCHSKASSAAGARRVAWLAALGTAQAAGIFSKESAAVLPAILVVYDTTWSPQGAWRRRMLSYAVLALPLAAWLYLRAGAGSMQIDCVENLLANAGFWTAPWRVSLG